MSSYYERHAFYRKHFWCFSTFRIRMKNIYMLFAGWEVRIVKNCDRGLENAARGRRPRAAFFKTEVTVFHYTDRPKPVNNLFIFFLSLKRLCLLTEKTHASVTVTVVRDRKIRTVLRTNQIAEFVTVTAWKKINTYILCIAPTAHLLRSIFPFQQVLPLYREEYREAKSR